MLIPQSMDQCEHREKKSQWICEVNRVDFVDIRNKRKKLPVLPKREKIDLRLRIYFLQVTQRRLGENDAADAPKFDK